LATVVERVREPRGEHGMCLGHERLPVALAEHAADESTRGPARESVDVVVARVAPLVQATFHPDLAEAGVVQGALQSGGPAEAFMIRDGTRERRFQHL